MIIIIRKFTYSAPTYKTDRRQTEKYMDNYTNKYTDRKMVCQEKEKKTLKQTFNS